MPGLRPCLGPRQATAADLLRRFAERPAVRSGGQAVQPEGDDQRSHGEADGSGLDREPLAIAANFGDARHRHIDVSEAWSPRSELESGIPGVCLKRLRTPLRAPLRILLRTPLRTPNEQAMHHATRNQPAFLVWLRLQFPLRFLLRLRPLDGRSAANQLAAWPCATPLSLTCISVRSVLCLAGRHSLQVFADPHAASLAVALLVFASRCPPRRHPRRGSAELRLGGCPSRSCRHAPIASIGPVNVLSDNANGAAPRKRPAPGSRGGIS